MLCTFIGLRSAHIHKVYDVIIWKEVYLCGDFFLRLNYYAAPNINNNHEELPKTKQTKNTCENYIHAENLWKINKLSKKFASGVVQSKAFRGKAKKKSFEVPMYISWKTRKVINTGGQVKMCNRKWINHLEIFLKRTSTSEIFLLFNLKIPFRVRS